MDKFCKYCKWCELNTNFTDKDSQLQFSRCDNPKNLSYNNLISGINIAKHKYTYCSTQRNFNWLGTRSLNVCGKEGRWYEARESI